MNVIIKYLTILFTLTCILILLIFSSSNIKFLEHDDVISILAATGNQSNYFYENLSDNIVFASEWQKLWKLNPESNLFRIGYELTKFDIHPPLYFWLLHLWIQIGSENIIHLLNLNIIFYLILIFISLRFFRLFLKSDIIYLVVSIAWILSGINFSLTLIIRQYLFLLTIIVLTTYYYHQYLTTKKSKYFFIIFILILAGLLTHYNFFLFIFFINIYVILFLSKIKLYREIFYNILNALTSFIVFIFIHPHFSDSFKLQREQAEPFSIYEIPYRALKGFLAVIDLFIPVTIIKDTLKVMINEIFLIIIFITLIFLAIYILKYKKRLIIYLKSKKIFSDPKYLPTFLFLTIYFSTSLLYIIQITPKHSMGTRYTVLYTPFIFVILGGILEKIFCYKNKIVIRTFITLLILSQIVNLSLHLKKILENNRNDFLPKNLSSIQLIILDNANRGVLPRVLWYSNPNSLVLVAEPKKIIEKLDQIPDSIKTLMYFSYNPDRSNANFSNDLIKELNYKKYFIIKKMTNALGFIKMYEFIKRE